MKAVYLGGASEVGASSIFLNIGGHNILLDSGIRQSKSKDRLPDFSVLKDLGDIEAIIISHAHMDHIGSLPLISKEFPKANIYMNRMTLELSRVLLYDSLKIMNYNEGEIPIFQEKDVLDMFDRVKVLPYEKEETILGDVKIQLFMAGHIAGASAVYIRTCEGTCFYTGDFSLTNALTINGMAIPKLRPDVVISETTYGDKLHANREMEEMRLIEKVKNTISNKGKVLIPVFALGRSQEVILILKRAIAKKQLENIPIYVDGMVQNINTVFQNNPLFLKESLGKKALREKELFYDKNVQKVIDDDMRKKIVESDEPSIIVSSSGMLIGGRSEYYASFIVQKNNNAIILTGYQDEESNGRMLLNLMKEEKEKRKLKLMDKVCDVACDIDIIGLSAHADKQEIKNLMLLLNPKKIVLGHGDTEVIGAFATEFSTESNASIYVPNVGEVIDIDIKNPRKQIDKKLEFLYAEAGSIEDFYNFIKEHYGNRLFTKEDFAYIYYGKEPSDVELQEFTNELIKSPYFTQDRKRYFMFKIADELDIAEVLEKEITNQELEEILTEALEEFPYKKISYYREEKKIVITFDFPKVIGEKFDKVCDEFFSKTGFKLEKNDNINNAACETVIREVIGSGNIDKISYLPMEDKFRIKVYDEVADSIKDGIEAKIGYELEFMLIPKKETISINRNVKMGEKMEQNVAIGYVKQYFNDKENQPYKIGLKNGGLILSFITKEIGLKYTADFNVLEEETGYRIELNSTANMVMVFNELNVLLSKLELNKIKNPSFLPSVNKVSVKLESIPEKKEKQLKDDFMLATGLELIVE